MVNKKENKHNSMHTTYLFAITVDKWNLHRRLIQPTFHANTLETFLGTFTDAANVLVQRIKDGPSQLNITHLVNQCVMDILNGEFVCVCVCARISSTPIPFCPYY